jgi:hypothetical protein
MSIIYPGFQPSLKIEDELASRLCCNTLIMFPVKSRQDTLLLLKV